MSFENIMRDCAAEEDRRQREAEAQAAEEEWQASVALSEARRGKCQKLIDAMLGFGNHDADVIRFLLKCSDSGIEEATSILRSLSMTYATRMAEINI